MSLLDEKIMTRRVVRSWESNDFCAAERASEAVQSLAAASPRKTSAEWYEVTTQHMLHSPRRPSTAPPRRPPKVWDDDCRSGVVHHESDPTLAQIAVQTLSSLRVPELAAVLRRLERQLVGYMSEESELLADSHSAIINTKAGESNRESFDERARPEDQSASGVRGQELLELAEIMAEVVWEGEQLVQRLPSQGR